MQNRKGMTLTELIVVIIVIPIVVFLVIALTNRSRRIPPGIICGTNLKGMANAFNIYAFDYDNKYPVQGAGTHTWGTTTTGWDDPQKDWSKSDGTMTVASSLYLLVREADVSPKSFICPKSDEREFVNKTAHDIVELWDFGPEPARHVSYSYQFPYGKFPSTGVTRPENAIMADRNPWFDNKLTRSSIEKESMESYLDKVSLIDPDDNSKWKQQIGNTQPHDREGQNVLFNDGHVEFTKTPDVGFEGDNIYTISGKAQEDKRRGIAPTADNIDAFDENDSLLVNDRKNKYSKKAGK